VERKSDYLKYRGKCKELSEQAVKDDISLTLVRGWYYCPIWNKTEQHYWCKTPDGEIIDPSCKQFPSNGHGIYREFEGFYTCEHCGEEISDSDKITMGNYVVCSGHCAKKLVGL